MIDFLQLNWYSYEVDYALYNKENSLERIAQIMKILMPDFIYKGVPAINLKELKDKGVKGILLDLDNTLINYERKLSQEVVDWVNKAKSEGFKICILSNSNKLDKIIPVAQKLELEYISFAKKPAKAGYLKASELLGLELKSLAMVGDQVFTDVVGANRLGITSVYVEPIDKKEYWYTKWKRPIEGLILNMAKKNRR